MSVFPQLSFRGLLRAYDNLNTKVNELLAIEFGRTRDRVEPLILSGF